MRHQKNIWNEELEFILLVKSYELLKEFPEIQNGDVENCTKLLQFWINSAKRNEYLSLEIIMNFILEKIGANFTQDLLTSHSKSLSIGIFSSR